jgi:hypothetical protein
MLTMTSRDMLTLDEVSPTRGYAECGSCGGTGRVFGVGRCRACNGKGFQTANDRRRWARTLDREAAAAVQLWRVPPGDPLVSRLRKSEIRMRAVEEPSLAPSRYTAMTVMIRRD